MRERFLPQVADGSLHVAFGVTEPDAGTDTTRITTRARRDGDTYVIRGRKVWTSKALEADRILLLTRTTPLDQCAKPTQGMTLFLVDRHAAGVGVVPIDKMGRNAVASCETTYDDVVVPVDDRVGEEGEGFRYLLDGLNAERILIAAEALGIGRVALRRAVDYANERIVFDRPIGKNQGIAFPLAEAHAKLRAAGLMVREAATCSTPGCRAARRRTWPSTWPPRPASSPPIARCRRSAASATPPSTTSSGTSARPACHASHRSAKN